MNINQNEINSLTEFESQDKPLVIILEKSYWGTCFLMRPIIEDLKYLYKGKINFHTFQEELPQIFTQNLIIKKYPTILFFRAKQLLKKEEGCVNRWQLFQTANIFYNNIKATNNSII